MADAARDIVKSVAVLVNTRLETGQRPFTDSELLGFVKQSMRDIVAKLMERDIKGLKVESTQTVPALTTSLTDAAGTLPPGLVQIIRMWERSTSPSGGTWVPMTMAPDHLPHNAQPASRLGFFEFRDNGIYLIGSTVSTDVRVQYWSRTEDFSMPDDTITLPDLVNAISYGAASLAMGGNPYYEQKCSSAWQTVANQGAHAKQGRTFRRRRMRRGIPILR